MRILFAYDYRGRLERWIVVWSQQAVDMVTARWLREGLTVEEK